MARLPREHSASAIYHIMLRGNEKRNIFYEDEDRTRFLDTLRVKKVENEFEMYAYCLMNNHVHLLIKEHTNSIARVMKCINVSYAFYFNKKYNRVGHLFQDRFRSEVIERDSYLLTAARYIHNNPIRAGIIDLPGKYEWSSYGCYTETSLQYGLVDTKPLLQLFSIYPDIAVQEFKKHTSEAYDDVFIDVNNEEIKEITTKAEALKHLEKLLSKKGVTLNDIQQQKGKVKGSFKHELVVSLKSVTNLSCREIGDLLCLNKSTVQELK